MSKVFITCALPYANGPTHLGHLRSTYIPADIYTRYRRLRGDDVLFLYVQQMSMEPYSSSEG